MIVWSNLFNSDLCRVVRELVGGINRSLWISLTSIYSIGCFSCWCCHPWWGSILGFLAEFGYVSLCISLICWGFFAWAIDKYICYVNISKDVLILMTKPIQFLNNHPTNIPPKIHIPLNKSNQSLINIYKIIPRFINLHIPFCRIICLIIESRLIIGICVWFL